MARDSTKAVTQVHQGPWDAKFLVVQPIDPVAEGHVIVIPREAHVKDTRNDRVFGETSACASRVAQKLYPGRDVNIITNQGPLAGQTMWHLHIHIVPRCDGDGLIMPWTGQKKGHYNTADKPAHPDSVKPKFPPKPK
jgi:histidine triad (HIT) family protein